MCCLNLGQMTFTWELARVKRDYFLRENLDVDVRFCGINSENATVSLIIRNYCFAYVDATVGITPRIEKLLLTTWDPEGLYAIDRVIRL